MIRHIVLFKFKPEATKKEMENLIIELESLKNNIETIRSIEVARDIGGKHNSCDLVINALFDSIDDVNAYLAHPAHVKALDSVTKLCEPTYKIDYVTNWVAM